MTIESESTLEFSPETLDYLASRPKSERSSLGQFLTPRSLRERLISQVKLTPGMRVLDPGVGTGEFLKACLEHQPNLYLEGWDIDPKVLAVAGKVVPKAVFREQSALSSFVKDNDKFDLVIGNPPYFEMTLTPELRSRYDAVVSGRANIFALFFKLSLEALKPNGVLAFVVPPSMNNGAYFASLRKYILETSSVEFLEVSSKSNLFLEANTAVQLIILRKGLASKKHTLDLGALGNTPKHRVILTPNVASLKKEFKDKTTLWNLGYESVTGSVEWNKNKKNLKSKPIDGAFPLVWSHNLGEGKSIILREDIVKKPQYLLSESKPLIGPAIVVNRIVGSVGAGTLRCALIPRGYKFYAENHVNVIRIREDAKQVVSWGKLLELLQAPEVSVRAQKLTGNTQISCIELTNWIPLDYPSK